MSEKNVIARPYAKAAYQAGKTKGDLEAWSAFLAVCKIAMQDKRMVAYVKDPKATEQQIIALLNELAADLMNGSDQRQNFLALLGKFKRFLFLPEIADLFEELRASAEKSINVNMISARPVSEAYQAKFQQALKNRLNLDVNLDCNVDESILGGAIIEAGDTVIDGSVRGRLAQLGETLGV